jgi:hypothetical protein
MTPRRCIAIAMVLCVHVALACTQIPTTTASGMVDSHDTALDSLRSVVQQLVGEATCNDVGECRLIGFGAKPCGGPASYLVFSIVTTDSVELASTVEQYNARQEELNGKLGLISDCALVEPPALACIDSRCTPIHQGAK